MKSAEKYGLIISLMVILVGSIFYFVLAEPTGIDIKKTTTENDNTTIATVVDNKLNTQLLNVINIKVAYVSRSEIKLFALAKNNELGKFKAQRGNSIPEMGSVVIGNTEAEVMEKEALFSEPGDVIKDLFGIDVKVEGILEKTNSPLDELYFLAQEEFLQLNGENDRVYIKYVEGKPKLFYYYPTYGNMPLSFDLAEGTIDDYTTHSLVGEMYYPLILGATEAKLMREENVFSKPGDIINDFLGKKMIVVGVLKETNNALDMMHFVPIIKQEF